MSDEKLKEVNAKIDSFGAVEFANKLIQEAERRGFMRAVETLKKLCRERYEDGYIDKASVIAASVELLEERKP